MTKPKGISYAPYFAGWFLTWPIIAYMGAQGFTGLVAFLAIPALLFARPRELRLYAVAGLAFILWVIAVSVLAPNSKSLLEGNLLDGTFTMDMVGARFGLTVLAGMIVFVAIKAVPEASAARSLTMMRTIGFVQGGGVLVTALFMSAILALLAPFSDPVTEMPQNLLRNANAFVLLLPLLTAWLWQLEKAMIGKAITILVLGLALFAFAKTGTQTAIFAVGFMLAAMAVVRLMPRHGFKAIFGGLAAYVALAPVLFGVGVSMLKASGLALPGSFYSRVRGWELVGEKINEEPLRGHGLEATYNWTETYADRPEWMADAVARFGAGNGWERYEILNSHPHNMPLQIWVETGAIGAFLAALTLLLIGFRLNAPGDGPQVSRYAIAGLIGVCAAVCSFSYSMWNEAFWASVAVAGAFILLQARQDAGMAR